MAPARRPLGALLETLRAPLLLSPLADVLAGASVGVALATGNTGPHVRRTFLALQDPLWERLPPVLLAALAGCCLLAAGMALNAWADRDDDRRRKPDRPLPRGAISGAAVRRTWILASLAGLALAALVGRRALDLALGIVVLTWLYHLVLKRWRIAGCLALGALRASLPVLGLLAVQARGPGAAPWSLGPLQVSPLAALDLLGAPALALPVAYGLYITGASLHASTDDEPPATRAVGWSRFGQGLCLAVLLLLLGLCFSATPWQFRWGGPIPPSGYVGAAVFAWAAWRLHLAATHKPPPAVTGVALSGLYLFQAGVAVHFGRNAAVAVLILLLFGLSRLLLRRFPPS